MGDDSKQKMIDFIESRGIVGYSFSANVDSLPTLEFTVYAEEGDIEAINEHFGNDVKYSEKLS